MEIHPRKRRRLSNGQEDIKKVPLRNGVLTDPMLTEALKNTRYTKLFQRMYNFHTVKSLKIIIRELGEPKWYNMKKCALVSILTLETSVSRIQRFYRSRGKCVRDRNEMFQGLKGLMCPITLAQIEDIPIRYRYTHSNNWYDRRSLSEFIRTSCDFIDPVSRVEFTRYDVCRIDKTLLELYNDRFRIRDIMSTRLENIQSVENELEEVFKEMIDMACVTPTRREFNVIMSYSEVHFEQCFKDLLTLDKERCLMSLKSLPDLLVENPLSRYSFINISNKRRKELEELVREFIYRGNYEQ